VADLAAAAAARDGAAAGPAGDAAVEPASAAPTAPASAEETARVADPQDVPGWRDPPPAPAWREPTLILPGGAVPARSPAPEAPAPADLDLTAPQSSSPWDDDDLDRVDDDLLASDGVSDPGGDLDDVDDGAPLDLELGGESLDDLDSDPRAPAPAPAGTPTPSGATPTAAAGSSAAGASSSAAGVTPTAPGAAAAADTPPPREAEDTSPRRAGHLGRELRKKMSLMAERLFPGRLEKAPVDIGLAHDAHTEIDLTAIGLEPRGAGTQAAPYEEIGGADTFADTNPLLNRLEPTGSPPDGMAEDADDTTGRRRSMASEPPARGDLTDVDVASLLGRLLQSRFTGRVQLRRGAAEKVVHFEEGRPIFAASNLPHDRMGDLLYREGKITREQQVRARDLVVESGRRMGEILVEMGYLKPRELLPAVRHHIEDIVYSLFAWDAGEFTITPGDPPGERIRLTRHPAALVLEGVRRKYGPEHLAARLGSSAAVVAVRSSRQLSAIAAVADLSPAERSVMQKLDGERTVQKAAEAAQVDPQVALQIAFGLVALGVAEIIDHGPAAAERPAPSRGRALVGETDIAIDRQRVLAKHALVNEADYFTLLGVRRDATSFEIRRAYEAARRDYAAVGFPPELQRELAGELSEIGQVIEEAYQVLRDERVRRAYQANLLD